MAEERGFPTLRRVVPIKFPNFLSVSDLSIILLSLYRIPRIIPPQIRGSKEPFESRHLVAPPSSPSIFSRQQLQRLNTVREQDKER